VGENIVGHPVALFDAMRAQIARSFAIRLLASEQQPRLVRRRNFDLDRLKRVTPFPTDPIDGIKSVAVTLLRLSNFARGLRAFDD
jgi:hypothetical protein